MSDDDNVAPALCPFCGGSADVSGYDFAWYARCSTPGCWARVNGSLYEDAAEAIAAWNRRAGLEAVRREERERCAKVAERGMQAGERVRDKMAPQAPMAGLEDALHLIVVTTARGIAANIRSLTQEGAAEGEGQGKDHE